MYDDPENPKTFIGIDNGQEVVADIVTLDGDFKLFSNSNGWSAQVMVT